MMSEEATPQVKKSKWLQEVEDDAVRITNRRFNEYFEDLKYQNAKKEEERQVEEVQPTGEEVDAPDAQPQKYLKQMNKSELRQVASDEGVEVDEEATNAEIVKAIEAQRKDK
jgi:hypothetical protein